MQRPDGAVADSHALPEQGWQALLHSAPEMLQWRTDALGRLAAVSAAADGRFAMQPIGQPLAQMAALADAQWLMQLLPQAPSRHGPRLLNLLDASGHPCTVRAIVDVGPGGLTITGVCTVQHENRLRDELVRVNNELAVTSRELARQSFDLERTVRELQARNTELVQAGVVIERLARTDPLTGLLNRRALHEELAREVERSHRHPSPLSVVALDVDHFKRVNDLWGHAAGDRFLVAAARVLLAGIRRVDMAVRLGGEELLLVLPQTGITRALQVAERLRLAVCGLRVEGVPEPVTISAGVAALAKGELAESLLHRADQALYAAKAGGRNCVMRARRRAPARKLPVAASAPTS
jgi:diguanylate cyclase (GGDEF)-like protein